MAEQKDNIHGRYYRKTEDGNILCYLCPRHCILKDGQKGFCFSRENKGGEMILTTYGHSSGFCIDPIEKKPLFHFHPGSSVLSFGTAGCNLGCQFCQNWNLSHARAVDLGAQKTTPDAIAKVAKKLSCKSVAFTYNEPVIFTEYAVDVANACHREGVLTVAVSAGYVGEEARKDFFEPMDAANIDLKAFSEKFYRRLVKGELKPVLDTLVYLAKETKVWLEVTNLIIPQENDSEEEITAMCRWIAKNLGQEVPLHFSAFHPDYELTDRPATPVKTLSRARAIASSQGLKYVYTGNVHSPSEENTYCPHCQKCLIERDYYELGAYHIMDGKCSFCQAAISGRFENKPGTWGSRRQPVVIGE